MTSPFNVQFLNSYPSLATDSILINEPYSALFSATSDTSAALEAAFTGDLSIEPADLGYVSVFKVTKPSRNIIHEADLPTFPLNPSLSTISEVWTVNTKYPLPIVSLIWEKSILNVLLSFVDMPTFNTSCLTPCTASVMSSVVNVFGSIALLNMTFKLFNGSTESEPSPGTPSIEATANNKSGRGSNVMV